MSGTRRISLAEAESLAQRTLMANEVAEANARIVARALVRAEADGQAGHGLSRLPSYALQARAGKVDGRAVPRLIEAGEAAIRIDAGHGFAYPAITCAVDALAERAPRAGIAAAAIFHSHHFGQAGAHVEALASRGLIGLMFGNSPKAMAFWGGRRPMLGTNPFAFACPLPDGPPLVIDLALSRVARGKINAARQQGKTIPEGWALDAEGRPTTDPAAALAGSMLPIGEAKGAAIALAIEILAAALTGSAFGFEASSLFDDKGAPPDLGHVLIALDPARLSGGSFPARMSLLLAAFAEEDGARLPGSRRLALRARAEADGLDVPLALLAEIEALNAGEPTA